MRQSRSSANRRVHWVELHCLAAHSPATEAALAAVMWRLVADHPEIAADLLIQPRTVGAIADTLDHYGIQVPSGPIADMSLA